MRRNPDFTVKATFGFFASLILAATAQADVPAYYYKGRHKVPVQIVTDTLSVETTAPAAAVRAVTGVQRGAITVPGGSKAGRVEVPVRAAASTAQLSAEASRIRAGIPGAQVQALLRGADADSTGSASLLTDRLSFSVGADETSTSLAARYNLGQIQAVPFAPDTYTAAVSAPGDIAAALFVANTMQESGDARWASPLVEQQKSLRLPYNDPMLPTQWHIQNTGTNTIYGTAGNDLNVLPAWTVATGAGVNIAINDEGVETSHPDLMANVRSDLCYDFNDNDLDPNPLSHKAHGTACAGVAAARANNGIGVAGVAPEASIAGLRLLAAPTTDLQEASALAWKATEPAAASQIHISSNSWGPSDNGKTLEGPGPLTEAAIKHGARQGRGGKGIVYVWAAGNGRSVNDNLNKDGYGNSPYVIAVSATTSAGAGAWYSEPGAAIMVNAPGGDTDGLVTTDNTGMGGANATDYRNNFTGTSAAAPAAAGVVALMLQANPTLTSRDVQHILVRTAVKNDPYSAGWAVNGAGLFFSHDYGFGRIDAGAAVTSAMNWQSLPEEAPPIEVSDTLTTSVSIPDNNTTGIELSFPVTAPAGFSTEHVEFEVDITHPLRGDVVILLKSPSGMVSELLPWSNDFGANYSHWRLRSVAHWGEDPTGTWTVQISDVYANYSGKVNAVTLRVGGYTAVTASAANWNLY